MLPQAFLLDGPVGEDFLPVPVPPALFELTDKAALVVRIGRVRPGRELGAIGVVVVDDDPGSLPLVPVEFTQKCGGGGGVDPLAAPEPVLVELAEVRRHKLLTLIGHGVGHLPLNHPSVLVKPLEDPPVGKARDSEPVLEAFFTGGCQEESRVFLVGALVSDLSGRATVSSSSSRGVLVLGGGNF